MGTPASARISSVELVCDRLLADIVGGRYAPGARLPGERDLARQLGASRPTLREALRRLAGWGLVAARRGSGVAVRPPRDWSLEVLPAYLRHGAGEGPAAGALLRDLLFLRRAFLVDIFRLVAGRLGPGALDGARAALHRAHGARDDLAAFVRADFEIIREVAEAARLLPALWFLNGLATVYFQLAAALPVEGPLAPDDYLVENGRVLDALERGDGDAACAIAAAYLAAHDRALLAALGVVPKEKSR